MKTAEYPNRRLQIVLRTIDRISDWCGRVFAFLVIAMALIILFGVIMRYVFKTPISWTYELSLYIFFAQMMMGGGYALLHGLHIKMDILYSHLSPRKQAVMDCITFLCFIFVVGMVLWIGSVQGWAAFTHLERSSTSWRPYLWPVKMIIPVSAFLLLLQGTAKFIRDLVMAVKGRALN
jgi:TRAP-type mannitol/chloroaromatic compound transport system permease small subunit